MLLPRYGHFAEDGRDCIHIEGHQREPLRRGLSQDAGVALSDKKT